MRVISFALSALCVPVVAQTPINVTSTVTASARVKAYLTLTTRPSSPAWVSLSESQQARKDPGGGTVIHRIVTDLFNRIYSGYDLIVEPQDGDPPSCLVTVRPLKDDDSGRPSGSEWTFVPPRAYPTPRVVHDGDTVEMTLLVKPDGQQAVDSVAFEVNPPSIPLSTVDVRLLLEQLAAAQPVSAAPPVMHIPFNEERAREFSGDSPDMRIWRPYVSLNGNSVSPMAGRSVEGHLPWLYLPNRGRYILSLVPREGLGFIKAGETRGSAIAFTLGDDTVELWTAVSVAPGDSSSVLYVLYEPDWAPTSSSQRSSLLLGTVDPDEVEALRKK